MAPAAAGAKKQKKKWSKGKGKHILFAPATIERIAPNDR